MKIKIVPYNPDWPKIFEDERIALRRILDSVAENIHHIGSTAVPGLAAKPIIDIMIEVNALDALDALEEEFIALGYEAKGEFGIAGRRFYRKGGDERTHHVHAFKKGDSNILRHLAFRDYLRHHSSISIQYANLKKSVALSCNNDIDRYCAGKDEFIRIHEKKALDWIKRNEAIELPDEKNKPNAPTKTITAFLGSSNALGNTRTFATACCEVCHAEMICLSDYDFTPWDYTGTNVDDDFQQLAERMLQSSDIIFCTPVYWYAMSTQMKTFFDRLSDLLTRRKEIGRSLAGKRTWLLVVGNAEQMPAGFEVPFKRTSDYLDMQYMGTVFGDSTDDKFTEEDLAKARAFGKRIANSATMNTA
jgi:GrpB-like predicted nucleotidyltransferase (UPF0157 family)/multimeric flavodoxin WrbA